MHYMGTVLVTLTRNCLTYSSRKPLGRSGTMVFSQFLSTSGTLKKLKIIKSGSTYMFKDGWRDLVQFFPIKWGCLIFFKYVCDYHIKMTVFLPNGIEQIVPKPEMIKDVQNIPPNEAQIHEQMVPNEEQIQPEQEVDSQVFKFTFTANERFRLPKGVVTFGKLDVTRQLTIINEDGHVTVMQLGTEKYGKSHRYAIKGWKNYMSSNGIYPGDKCHFAYHKQPGILFLNGVTT